jgi:hypothetical protein
MLVQDLRDLHDTHHQLHTFSPSLSLHSFLRFSSTADSARLSNHLRFKTTNISITTKARMNGMGVELAVCVKNGNKEEKKNA